MVVDSRRLLLNFLLVSTDYVLLLYVSACVTQAKAAEGLLKPQIAQAVPVEAVRNTSFFVKPSSGQGARGAAIQMRNAMPSFAPPKLTPLERGWSGTRMPGRSIGPPDPSETLRIVTRMTGNLGRICGANRALGGGRQQERPCGCVLSAFPSSPYSASAATRFASGKANDARAALRVAKNRAIQRLRYIDRFEGHTGKLHHRVFFLSCLFHDYFTQYGPMKVMVLKKPKGYGLRCQRVFREICKLVGITDINAKLVGCRARSTSNLVRAFILGLHNQVGGGRTTGQEQGWGGGGI
ncbi:hypothetical protein HPB48_026977 [Haemaphysalis longicornis]|uniref:Small ribosomal subunit protein uS5m n=1 Tax=Haemaphysalis longicornis TaxID=44386 RepID=A0A9J6HCU1_HAELO|nr:hypothetical protein HPB48_026977 [Haemaphysalis longicornis]